VSQFVALLASCITQIRATENSHFEDDKFPVLFWKSRKFPFRINVLFTSKHVHYSKKVAETDSFLQLEQATRGSSICFKLECLKA